MNIESIKSHEELLQDIGKQQHKIAQDYYKYRVSYAKLHSKMQFALAKRLTEFREKKSNIGIEMAMVWLIQEAQERGDEQFLKDYENYQVDRAKYKSLELALNALQNEQYSIQNIIKFLKDGEING